MSKVTLKSIKCWQGNLFNDIRHPLLRCTRHGTSWKQQVSKQEQIKKVVFQYAGKNARRADRIYAWGCSATGALGVRTLLQPEKHQRQRLMQLTPQKLDFMAENKLKAQYVDCGFGFTVFLCQNESGKSVVYGCGLNTDSQLGFHEMPLKSGNILDYVIEPVPIALPLRHPGTTKLTHVACGRAHTIIVSDNEGVFSLGNNAYGQCGRRIIEEETYRGSQTINRVRFDQRVKQVVCGQDHTLFVTDTGRVYSCGFSADGQTGVGHYDCVSEPTLVEGDIKGENIVYVSSKADTVLAVSDKGDIFGWGNNEYNQLGESVGHDEMQVNVPRHLNFSKFGRIVRVAAAGSMCALLNANGEVYTWGYGILGRGPKVEQSLSPEIVPEKLFGSSELRRIKVSDIFCGLYHMAACTESGDLFVWGKNRSACLGLGHVLDQFFPYKAQIPAEVVKVGCGVDHMVVLCKAFA